MSHPFGELLKQYRRRKPGFSQERLAHRIGYDEAVLVRMSQGKKDLTGPSGRDRVVRLIEVLHDEGTLHTLDEANALLAAAQLPPLYAGIPIERVLLQTLRPAVTPTSFTPTQPLHSAIHYALPAPVSSFVGRDHEIVDIAQLLQSSRLITLTGSGGSGKTRLALEAGAKQVRAFTHGACFVALAPVRRAEDIVPAIANALDVRESPETPILDSVKRFLANKSLLLVLDNFEHVLDGATAVSELLMAAPNVKVLATSREPLRLSGEQVFIVEPLDVPSAVELFAQRARAVQLGFRVDGDAPHVADICRRMDCLPLAIELAAARMREFTPAGLLANLGQRDSLGVLTDAPRDVPSRHRTLRSAIAWSYDLLNKEEQRVLRTLGVFVGGGEVDQIASVTASARKAAEGTLETLADKSLIRSIAQPDGTSRYLVLELIREFTWEQLQAEGELDGARRAHAGAFLGLAREGMWEIRSHAQLVWHERFERDYPNFRAALTWSFDEGGSELIGCQLVEALTYFWFIATRYLAETKTWTERALAARKPEMPPEVLGGLSASVIINGHLWPFEEWVKEGREALVHYNAVQNARGIAISKYGLAAGLLGLNPHDEEGMRVLNECLSLCRETGNEWTESHALHTLGIYAIDMNDLAQAESLHREMVAIRRRLGNVIEISIGLWQLGGVLMRTRRFEEANDYLRESAALAQQVDSPQDVLHANSQLGDNLLAMGDVAGAINALEGCVALARNRLPAGDLINPLGLLAKAESARGNHAYAHTLIGEAVQIMHSLNRPGGAYLGLLETMAVLALARGDAGCYARLRGSHDAHQDAKVRSILTTKVEESDMPHIAKARAALGDDAYEAAYAEGRALSLKQAIEFALDG